MSDTTINLIFQNSNGGGSESDPTMPGATPNPESPETTKESLKESANALTLTKALGVRVGKQAVNMASSRVGVVTRSNLRQQKINAGMKAGAYAVTFIGSVASQNYFAAALTALSFIGDNVNESIAYNENARTESARLSILGQRYQSNVNRSR